MELTHKDKNIIKLVIEGFTYHQKYKLYVELAKDLNEEDEFKDLVKLTKPLVKDLMADNGLKGNLKTGLEKISTMHRPKNSKARK